MLNIKSLRLGNYKIFSDTANIRLAPLTIITGPDGSGKSSIAGSLSLMKGLEKSRLPYRLRLDSGIGGCFETIKNNKTKRNRISIGYDIHNIILGEDVSVNLTFQKEGDFDAVARSINISTPDSVLYNFEFEEGRLMTRVGTQYLCRKLKEIKKSKKRFFELEREFRKIKSSSGSYKEKSGSPQNADSSNIRIFHIDNDLKRKNVKAYLNQQAITTEEYERLFYFFGKQRKPAGINGNEIAYISRIKKILSDFNEDDILLDSNILKSILKIPANELNENNLRIVLKAEHPDLYDCLLLLDNDALTRIADLLKVKNYKAYEQEYLANGITTSERLKDSLASGELSGALEHHMQTIFGETSLFMAFTDLCSSREEFLQVYYSYRNLNALNSFCELVLDKVLNDLGQDLEKSIFLPLFNSHPSPSVDFNHPMHELIRDYSQNKENESFLKLWLKKFGICDELNIQTPVKGMGYFPGLKRNNDNYWLSSEGAGTNRILSMLLNIVNAKQSYALHDFNDDVRNYPRTLVIEEPEARMHPAWQSKIAMLFTDAYRKLGLHFMIETYSEYFIRKLQYMVATGQLDKSEVVIYYVENPCRGLSSPVVKEITIDEEGNLSQEPGKAFFDDGDASEMEMLRLKKINRN